MPSSLELVAQLNIDANALQSAAFAEGMASVVPEDGTVTLAQEALDISSALAPVNAALAAMTAAKSADDSVIAAAQALVNQLLSVFPQPAPSPVPAP